jgi:hypothetical protein
VDERPDEPGVPGRASGQHLVQPGRDPVEGVVALGQDPGVDEDLADVILAGAGWQVIKEVVGEGLSAGREVGEQARVRAPLQPLQHPARVSGRGESLDGRRELPGDLAARAGQVTAEPLRQQAPGTESVSVKPPAGPAALA